MELIKTPPSPPETPSQIQLRNIDIDMRNTRYGIIHHLITISKVVVSISMQEYIVRHLYRNISTWTFFYRNIEDFLQANIP